MKVCVAFLLLSMAAVTLANRGRGNDWNNDDDGNHGGHHGGHHGGGGHHSGGPHGGGWNNGGSGHGHGGHHGNGGWNNDDGHHGNGGGGYGNGGGWNNGGGHHGGGGYGGDSSSHSSSEASSSSSSSSSESEEPECNKCADLPLVGGAAPLVTPTKTTFDQNGCDGIELTCDFASSTPTKGYMMFNDDVAAIVNADAATQKVQQKLTCSASGGWEFTNKAGTKVVAKSLKCKAAVCDTCTVKLDAINPVKPTLTPGTLNTDLCRVGEVTCDGTAAGKTTQAHFFSNTNGQKCANQCTKVQTTKVPYSCNTVATQIVTKIDGADFVADNQIKCESF